MRKITTIVLLLFFVTLSCTDNDNNNWIELDCVETGCMNGWDDFYTGNNDYRHVVENYLEHNGISVYRVYSHSYYDGPVCLACTCPTGRLIVIRIAEKDKTKAEELGFHLINNGDFNVPENDGTNLIPEF